MKSTLVSECQKKRKGESPSGNRFWLFGMLLVANLMCSCASLSDKLSECKNVGTNVIILNTHHEGPVDRGRAAVLIARYLDRLTLSGFKVYLARSFVESEIGYFQKKSTEGNVKDAQICASLTNYLGGFLARDTLDWEIIRNCETNSNFVGDEWLPWSVRPEKVFGKQFDNSAVFIEPKGPSSFPVLEINYRWATTGGYVFKRPDGVSAGPAPPLHTFSAFLRLNNPIDGKVYRKDYPASAWQNSYKGSLSPSQKQFWDLINDIELLKP